MPFTALHPEVGRIDSTQPDLGAGLTWEQVFRVSPRVALRCPECGWAVHAKHSPHKVKYFCHDGGRPQNCSLANESREHHMLKLECCWAVRDAGWYAELEVAAPDGSWRADVMATSPDGSQRIAWEAQLSAITVEDIQARTDRYAAAGIGVCWVSPHGQAPVWMGVVPSVRVRAPQEVGEVWRVDDGLGSFASDRWSFREADLAQFVCWVVRGQLRPCRSLPHQQSVVRDTGASQEWLRRELWWTSRTSAQAQDSSERERRRIEEARRCREEAEALAAQQRHERAQAQRVREEKAKAAARARREVWLATPAGQIAQQRRRELQERKAAQQEAEREAVRRLLAQQAEEQRRFYAERRRERDELQREAKAAGQAWWDQLTHGQVQDVFVALAQTAWEDDGVRIHFPKETSGQACWAYGIPVHSDHLLYGIVRPCPELIQLSPQLAFQQVFARNATELQSLERNGLRTSRLAHLGLGERRQAAEL
ncbi:competence protein CoiA family protein [Streptomyces sp. NPDC001941]|uniref:competence protein CoiA n=1 Tax=Streptomyces sp. NPDC001941 TaxID=3154659 RepID=UPI003334A296